MKQIMIMLAGIILISCGPTKEEWEAQQKAEQAAANPCVPLYKMGDVVDIKPDSAKVVIINIVPEYCPHVVYYVRNAQGVQEKIQEELIFHKEGIVTEN